MYLILPIIAWIACFAIDKGSNISSRNRGGGGQPETPEAPPTPQETSAEAISAQIDATPRILATQKEYGPQFTQQQLDQLNQFGPQFAQSALALEQQFGPQMAAATLASQKALDPARAAGSEAITSFINAGPGSLTAEDEAAIQESVRAASSVRGLAESGFSAQEEVNRLFGARQALRTQYLNIAQSSAGQLPAAGGQSVSANPLSVGSQLIQNINPSDVFGAQAANNQFNSSIFSTQSQAATAARGQNMSMISDVVGGAMGVASAF